MTLALAPLLRRTAWNASNLAFWPTASEPAPAPRERQIAVSAKWRLLAEKELARPGFMSLQAVREHGQVVDFVWDSASAEAARWLGRDAAELCGRRLSEVLSGHLALPAVFARYRCVVQTGAGAAIKHLQPHRGCDDVIRHGAVRLGDGVAVTVTNLSAFRRVKALRIEVALRRALPMISDG